MAAPAIAERTRAAAGTIPSILNEAAPDEREEGLLEALPVDVPEEEPEEAAEMADETEETDDTGVVALDVGVVPVLEGAVVVPVTVDAGRVVLPLVVEMENAPVVE